ncbi:assimilatory sulfite reductase [Lentinula raphanica]|uniref:assimilatory sulfite reductase (NADPH) n=1 Tax=Lentinula raphanica TaxID=153919 RepID=A0AA38PCG7_9AGAR|nr:assimilatory sulfite reductase [Lentinula raphanica]
MAVDVPEVTTTSIASSVTLVAPASPKVGAVLDASFEELLEDPRVSTSTVVEYISSRTNATSSVYIYDLAEQVGFGTLTKIWSKAQAGTAPVIDLQTRAGAGLSLVGRLSEGTSSDTANGAVLTAFTSPQGLSLMAPALSYLPPATASSRLVVQVPNITPTGESFALSPTLASFATVLPILPENIVILASATSQETVHFTQLSYQLSGSHVVHIFDHFSSSRELGQGTFSLPEKDYGNLSVSEAIRLAGYSCFEYVGDAEAHTVVLALNGPLAVAAKAIANKTRSGFAVVSVNVLRPWDEAALRSVLPVTVKTIHVLDDVPNTTTKGPLYIDVFSTLLDSSNPPVVHSHRITPSQTQIYVSQKDSFKSFLASFVPGLQDPVPAIMKKLMFFGTPNTTLSDLPLHVEGTLSTSKSLSSRLSIDHDVFSKRGGITASRILLAPRSALDSVDIPIPIVLPFDAQTHGEVDFLAILDHTILKTHSLLKYAKPHSPLLIVTSWTAEELFSNLPSQVTKLILERELRLFIINVTDVAEKLISTSGGNQNVISNIVAYLAFMRMYLGGAATEENVLTLAIGLYGENVEGVDLAKLNSETWDALEEVLITQAPAEDKPVELKEFEFNAIAIETDDGDTVVNGAHLSSWHDAAKHLLFPSIFNPLSDSTDEEFPQNPSLRPELPERTYLVTCTVNRRLTPKEYDRNVFHLEFDTSGTGLKYAIGEALGVHGWNDEQEVTEFCEWYGVDPKRLVTIPVPGSEDKFHTRTVFQALQQQIDLFGRPPKSFYTDLADYATSKADKYSLQFIGSAEGSSTFKKMGEKDTVTFADVLKLYPSARPGIEVLCGLIGDIKPRHYSIASAQSVVGDRVDLLVVTVDWVTPSGSPRYGQCTRYLAGLQIGQKVTVSIKPSVMKLPPDDTQPLVMAGLGTGAAPFRAFLQHKALLHSQGKPIGPVYYYFGSRHQSQEYLYGEEIEAFILDGIITRAGLAFSRDGPPGVKKVYIQHKMLEDAQDLARMLKHEQGVFYLCGPTWPVPDMYEALCGALEKYQGMTKEEAGDYLEGLKEEERYVLEVY